MKVIESKENTIIKYVRQLNKKKYRNEKKQFVIEGFRFVSEALESSFKVEYVLVNEMQIERYNRFKIEDIFQNDTKVFFVKDNVFTALCSTNNPQGILAVVNKKNICTKNKDGFYILADKIQDPGNMGTIIRSAHAAGALGIILTKGTVEIYNDKTLRSTMGSIFKIPIIEDMDLSLIKELKEQGFRLITSSLNTSNNIFNSDLSGKIIIAVGNEGNGISSEIYSLSDISVKIPMMQDAESLNAAVAAGVIMFESVRQRQ